ncbi:hypothetical protein [Flaviflexus huanghaiensis]|uniref:hypothetical protein n=1 Tax=Flaviflexus huanghaiensis TaxID=1111473 RepID=UPI0015F8E6C1|nr:hypothetical protein [Flaviflexus huanghaiensis]
MSGRLKVDVVADYGPPERTVSKILKESDFEGVRQVHRQLPLRPNGELDLDGVMQWAAEDRADLLIVVTETPRRTGPRPKIAGIYVDEGLAIISLPALGVVNVQHKLEKVIATTISIYRRGQLTGEHKSALWPYRVGYGRSKSETRIFVHAPRVVPGRFLLVLGMVKMNEPIKTLPKLTSALAAAAATSAFGIFYGSIWQMADALPTARLAAIALTVIVLMAGWLISSNRLWNRGRRYGSIAEGAMYNAAVVVTILMSVVLLYLALFIGVLLAGLIIIEAGYLSDVLGEKATFRHYLDIAWLAASMGTVAGALGSNFDSDDDIKQLTHGRREALRMEERD